MSIGLYAIVSRAPAQAQGARGEPLRTLAVGEVLALVGDEPPALSIEALRAHEAAVRRISEATDACLPARFGCAAGDDEGMERLLRNRAQELAEALALVRGREQMTLRIHGKVAPARAMALGGPGTRYLEERRKARRLPELDPLRTALGALARAERIERHTEPGLLASVYHLIDRGSAAAYGAAVRRAELHGLHVSVSGPWPAWSFAPEVASP